MRHDRQHHRRHGRRTSHRRRLGRCPTITLCGQLDALQDDFTELFNRRKTVEQERATDHEMAAPHARADRLMAEIEAAGPPTTMAGIVAVARAGLAMHPCRDTDGTAIEFDESHWLLLAACKALIASGLV